MKKLTTAEMGRMSVEQYREADKLPLVVVLDNVRSQHNVGAVFRTADAMRIERVVLCGICCCPPNQEIHKTALGADETVPWRYFKTTEEACRELKSMGYRIFAVEQVEGSVMLQDFKAEPNTAFILGNEVDGVSEEALPFCDAALEIPQEGTKHSLNVSVCSGILMWNIFEQLFLKKG